MAMPTYLYCLRTDRVAPADGLTGVDGAVVHAVHTAGLTARVSDVASARPTLPAPMMAICMTGSSGSLVPLDCLLVSSDIC